MSGKKILGLDLGTTSIGWALVNERENGDSEIIKLGVRVNPLTVDEKTDFEKGKPLSTNADRTLKRGARRNLQRFKQRRSNLIEILVNANIIQRHTELCEVGKNTTFQTLNLRARAAVEKIDLEDFARVLLAINKKRGYKSSRKSKGEDEGVLIDGMAIAKVLFEEEITPGEFVLRQLLNKKNFIPDFYRSDLKKEFDKVWDFQKQFYLDILTDELYQKLDGQGLQNSRKLFLAVKGVYTADNKGKREEVKLQHYTWRVAALRKKLPIEEVAYVLAEINNNLNKSSGYLGAISDRSKKLYFNNLTVGQYLFEQIAENRHTSLKNQVFYRQDYLDEFERIWETQSKFHKELTSDLKTEIRDVIIFYQRKLKSQKHLISECQFEKHHKVVPKSSPIFQEFKIWQNLNSLEVKSDSKDEVFKLDEDAKEMLYSELNLRGKLDEKTVLRLLDLDSKKWKSNFPEGLEGNNFNNAILNALQEMLSAEGYGFDWSKKSASEINHELQEVLEELGIVNDLLVYDINKPSPENEQQNAFKLWHLLYSAEDDMKVSKEDIDIYGQTDVNLKKALHQKFGIPVKYLGLFSSIALQPDYGSLSARAIKKVIPHLQAGHIFSEAAKLAGYNHSNSMTKEELDSKDLKPKLDLLKKNSLRNPVVEKILNQLVNLINQIIETYGKPDEIRIELARELKKSAKQREEMTKYINAATRVNDDIRKTISKDFGIPNPTKNDVVRYKLWLELKDNGFHSIFTNTYIPKEKLFSKAIDIEHIIPKAILFDDSFSNKTLAYREVNLKKGARTGIDFISEDYSEEHENYKARVESLFNNGKGSISKSKYKKLLMSRTELPDSFIESDMKNTQYIAKKALQMLKEVCKTVIPTTGTITDKLREDWDLINVMKELNLPKYELAGLTTIEERKGSKKVKVIKDWTKRNDHRHHAMDALTVAFTTHNHIQYLNNLNAASNKDSRLYAIKQKITTLNKNGNRVFVPPMTDFRTMAKNELEKVLISFKAKNKVVTKNINKTKKKGKDQYNKSIQLTPRGQLHKETVYAKRRMRLEKPIKIDKKFSLQKANLIIHEGIRQIVSEHLKKHDCNPNKAFDTKLLKKEPILYKGEEVKTVQCFEEIFTIRKDITPDLKIDKVVDIGVKRILEDRLAEYGGDAKTAFSNLETKPIWLNEKAGISIKRVSITGVSNAEALHFKKDQFGNDILENGKKIPADFVSTGNNHHVAIYEDENGDLQEQVVSFFEAVARVNSSQPIIDKTFNSELGWKFLFSMKQNEMFIFPNDDFDPNEVDLFDEKNLKRISAHLYRVQKFTTKDYFFRHHFEATLNDVKSLSGMTWLRTGLKNIKGILKVRINHIGEIAQVGEY